LPYGQRRQLLEDTIKTIRLYNKNYYIAEKYTGNDPVEFYLKVINDPRGLPYSEGIVVKNKNLVEESYFKIKNRDFQDLIAIAFIEGTGKYSNNLGAMLVEDPTTGGQGEIGSFGITDAERTWIWLHRNELEGAVAKISVMELTNGNSPRAGVFHSWHPDPRYGKIGSELALAMYAEASSGMDPEQSSNSMFAMKTKAGWRKK
jgi:ATP-dependent DNA ligase